MSESQRSLDVLSGLNELGVRLSCDDFGTGYSSLAHLRRLPIGEIKIDKSFIARMAVDESDRAIARSVLALGRDLGLVTVAEGVESREGWDLLTKLGCDLAQGFVVCPPLTAPPVRRLARTPPARRVRLPRRPLRRRDRRLPAAGCCRRSASAPSAPAPMRGGARAAGDEPPQPISRADGRRRPAATTAHGDADEPRRRRTVERASGPTDRPLRRRSSPAGTVERRRRRVRGRRRGRRSSSTSATATRRRPRPSRRSTWPRATPPSTS